MINHLKSNFEISFLGFECKLASIQHYKVYKVNSFRVRILRLILKLFRINSRTEFVSYIIDKSCDLDNYELIICHDLELLPYLYRTNIKAKVLFDAREYYPRHFEHNLYWKILQAPFQQYLCEIYLPKVDKAITVSKGICVEYFRQFNIKMDVIYSFPPQFDIRPSSTVSNLRLIHHGNALAVRCIERMIYAMDSVREGVSLDLMLIGNSRYYNYLKGLCSKRHNVNMIPAVRYEEIIPLLNKYDLGLVFFPPLTFNLMHCMPNKLFDYIQARLGIVAAPLYDIKNFVEKENLGVISESFTSKSLAITINKLTKFDIHSYKKQANVLSRKYSQETSKSQVVDLVRSLL